MVTNRKAPGKASKGTLPARSKPGAMDAVVEAYKRDVDRTLVVENLRRSVEERFLNLMQLQRFAEELQRARKAARHSG